MHWKHISPLDGFTVRYCDRCTVRVANPMLLSDADAALRFCTIRCQDADRRQRDREATPELVVTSIASLQAVRR